jgi:hypothetical protein
MTGLFAFQIGLSMLAGLWLVAAGTTKKLLEWKRHDAADGSWWRRKRKALTKRVLPGPLRGNP